jgi:uncharacterized OsmC-like protein
MYHVDITNKGDSSFDVKSKDYELVVDTKGKGITPPDTLLAGLGTCMGVYIRKYAEGMKISLNEFSISLEADFSKKPPICFKEIKVNVDLKGVRLDERKKRLFFEFIKNCPVHNTLKNNPIITVNLF